MQIVKKEFGSQLIITWKYFSLEQVNSKKGPDWKLWEQSDAYLSRSLKAFHAAEAARRQGEAFFDAFHYAVLRAKNEGKQDITDTEILSRLADNTGLEMEKFSKDLGDRRLLDRLEEDHTFAIEKLGVFGTPTLVFPEQQAIFLRLSPPPSSEEAVAVFEDVRCLAENRRQIKEIKRPQV